MKYHLAQLNIGKFKQAIDDPVNKDFVDNLDRVNALAESSDGFIWRLVGDGNDALDIRAFEDPNMAVNLSIWESRDALFDFVYGNEEHTKIMKRRREWFERLRFYMVLWYVPVGHIPSIKEAVERLEYLEKNGVSEHAFTFAQHYDAPQN